MQLRALPGFRDFYPEEAALRNHIFDTWRSVATRYGFVEYEGPPLEPLELYVEKSGEEIVGQLYSFTDKGGREVSLRPEMTPTLARMVAAKAQGLKKPIRWFSVPQLFRYERQQRGRLREHYQLNVDVIGESTPIIDAEVIAVAVDVLRELGLDAEDFEVRVSDRSVVGAILAGIGVAEDQLAAAYAAMDKVNRSSAGELIDGMVAKGMSQTVASEVLQVASIRGEAALRERLNDTGIPASADRLFATIDALGELGLDEFVKVDASIVRGLAYYTGVVFELFDVAGELRAICGGGRYDDLLQDLGSVDLPAIGFGMGDVVLGELLKEKGVEVSRRASVDAFVVAVSSEDLAAALRVSSGLRQAGLRVEQTAKTANVGKQMKLAAARGAKFALVIGPDERESGEVVVRELETGDEERVAQGDLVEHLSSRI